MRGPIHFDRPAGEEQPDDDGQHELFLFRQPIHGDNLIKKAGGRNRRIGAIYDLRFVICAAK